MKKIVSNGRYTLDNGGFAILELVLSFFIFGIIVLSLVGFFGMNIRVENHIENRDDILKNVNFGLMYMEREIQHSEANYKLENLKGYKKKYDDLGILIGKEKDSEKEHTYSYYYFNGNSLIRRTITRGKDSPPTYSDLMNNRLVGVSVIISDIDKMKANFDGDTRLLEVNLEVKNKKKIESFTRMIYIYNLEVD